MLFVRLFVSTERERRWEERRNRAAAAGNPNPTGPGPMALDGKVPPKRAGSTSLDRSGRPHGSGGWSSMWKALSRWPGSTSLQPGWV